MIQNHDMSYSQVSRRVSIAIPNIIQYGKIPTLAQWYEILHSKFYRVYTLFFRFYEPPIAPLLGSLGSVWQLCWLLLGENFLSLAPPSLYSWGVLVCHTLYSSFFPTDRGSWSQYIHFGDDLIGIVMQYMQLYVLSTTKVLLPTI